MLEINQYKPKQQTNAYITQDKLNSGKYLQILQSLLAPPGFEPGTSWSKVEHSTTIPYPPPNIVRFTAISQINVFILQLKRSF